MSSIRKEIDITYKSITSFFILQLIIGALSIKTEPLILISYLFAYVLLLLATQNPKNAKMRNNSELA